MKETAPEPRPPSGRRALLAAAAAWAAMLLLFFYPSLQSGKILFSSDGPLGANAAAYARLPSAFLGMWQDLNWTGGYVGSAFPSATYGLLWALGPYLFAKLYTPASLFLLAWCAWFCFRQLGFRPYVCWLAAAAAMFNGDLFSYACWGLGTHALAGASLFLAIGVLAVPARGAAAWIRDALAGFAVGIGVMEGFDSGAILSLYAAAAAMFQSLTAAEAAGSPLLHRLGRGAARVVVMALAAAWIAAQALTVLIGTQVKGVVGMGQDVQTKTQRWDAATQWSLPKIETLRIVIPGLFGYRMDTPDGGNYWGRVGELPSNPKLMPRHSGAGPYAGVAVVVLGLWAASLLRRKKNNPLTPAERRWVAFWAAAALLSLALAWGRHAPFYRILYALPYFSTIRNPIKFLHPFSVAAVILFAYGLEALWREYSEKAFAETGGLRERIKQWWAGAAQFERRWTIGLCLAWGAGVLGWLMYGGSKQALIAYLRKAVSPAELAPKIAAFSLTEVGWFLLFFGLTILILVLIWSGVFGGARRRLGMSALALLLLLDFYRADLPWVVYWNFAEKYAPTELTEKLRTDAHQHRVAALPMQINQEYGLLQQLYFGDWLQHRFRYYNIQSLDVVQEPRPSADNAAYRAALYGKGAAGLTRLWELTNTRYLLAPGGPWPERINQQLDPKQRRFRVAYPFSLERGSDSAALLTRRDPAGPFALLEFTGALPRASLFDRWQVLADGRAALEKLADPAFDPHQTVLLDQDPGIHPAAEPSATNAPAGEARFLSYSPKHIVLEARAERPAILLLNDKFDPHWRARIDGKPARIMRGNYLMRALALPPGTHRIEFAFRVSPVPLAASLAGLAAALAAALVLKKTSKAEA